MLPQDDNHNLEEFVGTYPYDGKFFLRVYNPLKGPMLCMGKDIFLTPFLYFVYDLVNCASFGDKIYFSEKWKFINLSCCQCVFHLVM